MFKTNILNKVQQKLTYAFDMFFKKFLIVSAFVKKYRIAVFSAIAVITLVITVAYSGITVAYSVSYNGEEIAVVRNKNDYDKAFLAAKSMVRFYSLDDYTCSPKFTATLTVENQLTKAEDIAVQIIENTESIEMTKAILLNGELFACASKDDDLTAFVDSYLASFNPVDCEAYSEFDENVELAEGYYPVEKFESLDSIKQKLSSLDVKTTVVMRREESIPYSRVTRKSDIRPAGEIKKIVNGVNGVSETVRHIVYLNGEEISNEVIEKNIISNPVDEVTVIGTLPSASNGTSSSQVSALNLIWPLQRVSNQIITSYFGDMEDRDSYHKGLDIASPYGTPIYAAQSGTVVLSQYSSSYGNYIIIDHGNGYRTLYAHCSALHASYGETVTQGQVIAAVGSTGYSTGNHLHFEVTYNGTKLNPGKFLGV